MHFWRLKEIRLKNKYPVMKIKTGMLLELHEDVWEADAKRTQKFRWLVVQVKKPNQADWTFTIRGTVAGVIVEKIFPLSFTKFEKVLLLDEFAVRRSRINYIREKVGKWAKLKSMITVERKEKDLLLEAMQEFKKDETTKNNDEVVNSDLKEKVPMNEEKKDENVLDQINNTESVSEELKATDVQENKDNK